MQIRVWRDVGCVRCGVGYVVGMSLRGITSDGVGGAMTGRQTVEALSRPSGDRALDAKYAVGLRRLLLSCLPTIVG